MRRRAPNTWQYYEKRKWRWLRTLYQRELNSKPPVTKEWFKKAAWSDTILNLVAEGLVVQFPDVRLTAAGRRFVRRHLAKTADNQTDIGTDD